MADPTVGDTTREKREAIIRIAGRHGATDSRSSVAGTACRVELRPGPPVGTLQIACRCI